MWVDNKHGGKDYERHEGGASIGIRGFPEHDQKKVVDCRIGKYELSYEIDEKQYSVKGKHGVALDVRNIKGSLAKEGEKAIEFGLYDMPNSGNGAEWKELLGKVEQYGLIDLFVGRNASHMIAIGEKGEQKIEYTPDGGEIFIVGRSLAHWHRHECVDAILKAIVDRDLKFTFVLAAPDPELKSLVKGDHAELDVQITWKKFERIVKKLKEEKVSDPKGAIQVYGIGAYLPVSFSSYQTEKMNYCQLEVGITIDSSKRSSFFLKNVDSNDGVYTSLHEVYRKLIENLEPILKWPEN